MISVTVCYATPEKQVEIALSVENGCIVSRAIQLSQIEKQFPNITINHVGIFGRMVSLDHVLQGNDRVEIYRELTTDPKEARRLRANIT